MILHEWIAFYSAFLNIHRSGVLTALAWLVLHETASISARSVYTIQPCTMSLHAKHIRKVHACLAVTFHLRFWQNDRGLLRATAVTRGWNGYRNKKYIYWSMISEWRQQSKSAGLWQYQTFRHGPILYWTASCALCARNTFSLSLSFFFFFSFLAYYSLFGGATCGVSVWNGGLTDSTASVDYLHSDLD